MPLSASELRAHFRPRTRPNYLTVAATAARAQAARLAAETLAPAATLQANLFDDSANQYAIGVKYRFNDWASWYAVASEIVQGPGAHYCLGASGHGYQICSRDQFNNTIGGATIKAGTTGMTFDF